MKFLLFKRQAMKKSKALLFAVLLILLAVIGYFIKLSCDKASKVPAESEPVDTAGTEPEQLSPSELAALEGALADAPVLTGDSVGLRKFPYPYKAMLCIISDCDSTTIQTFARVHRYLNSFEDTPYGKGLGLDISDSFFVYNGSNLDTAENLMSYCAGVDPDSTKDADLIKHYYDCGWIDSIHAFGDFSNSAGSMFSRTLAERAWELLDQAGITPTVWIDHGTYTNVQNFGAYNPNNASSYQMGDNPVSPYYHTDLSLNGRIKYVWYSRHSDAFGQDYPLSIRQLRDGKSVWSFQRYTSEMLGSEIDWNWRPNRIHDQITPERLDVLEEQGQYALIANHLTVFQEDEQFGPEDLQALELLASRYYDTQTILVARTSRVLDYALAQRYISFKLVELDGATAIQLLNINDPVGGEYAPTLDELRGLTFYVADPVRTAVYLGTERLNAELTRNPADESGRASVSIAWFAPDTKDYSLDAR